MRRFNWAVFASLATVYLLGWQHVGGAFADASEVSTLASRIATSFPAEKWSVHQCDTTPSVAIDGNRGYRIVLRRTWKEYLGAPQQRAEVNRDDEPFELRHADWELVLFPAETTPVQPDLRSRIDWAPDTSPYHVRSIYLGTGWGHVWFTRATLWNQDRLRRTLELNGGDDRIQLLVDGLTVEDTGNSTANTCRHLVGQFDDAALPYLKKAIAATNQENHLWRIIGSLAYIRTVQATEMLLELYGSDARAVHEAAVYALVHEPYRESAKAAYLDMLRHQDRVDRLSAACQAAREYGWQEAIPILKERVEHPGSVAELRVTLAAHRDLQGDPIPQRFTEAERTMWRLSGNDRSAELLRSVDEAQQFLVEASDANVANLVALSLLGFVTKGNVQPVHDAAAEILRARPREETLKFLDALSARLPATQHGLVTAARRALREEP